MKVALDARCCLSEIAGIGRYTLELARELPAVGVDVSFWYAVRKGGARHAWCERRLQELRPGIPVHAGGVPNVLLYSQRAQSVWRRWPGWLPPPRLLPADLDLYHAVLWPLPLTLRPPLVLTIHDLIGVRHPEWFYPERQNDLETLRLLAPRAAHVLTDSAATRQDVLELTGCDPDRVTTVLLGVDSEFYHPADEAARAAVREQYGLDRPYVVSLGTLEPRKNLPRLVEAYDRYCETSTAEVDLVVLGARGWGDDQFAPLLDRPRRGRVRPLGYVPTEELPALLSAASAMAYLSLYEGFGLPPLEAMACGCPVVCSNTTSLPEVIGDAGVLVDPLDVDAIAAGLSRVLDDAACAADLGARGRARACELTWRATAEQTARVYHQVLDERSGKRAR